MEKILQQILTELKDLKADVQEMKPKVEESHTWLSALYHNSQVHKADIDQIQHKIAIIEGAMVGAANSLLEPLKKAQ